MIEGKARIAQINNTLQAIQNGWPFLCAAINERLAEHTESLICQDCEQTRGRIKALKDLLDLPVALQQERDAITAELPETDSAD